MPRIYCSPLYPWVTFHGSSYLRSTMAQKQMILLLTYSQNVNSSLMLRHSAYLMYLTLSHLVILSSHIIARSVSTVK